MAVQDRDVCVVGGVGEFERAEAEGGQPVEGETAIAAW